MTDEALIAWLRSLKGLGWSNEAADRVEALIAERDEYHGEAMAYIEKWGAARKAQDEAEAKLVKAVEALEYYAVEALPWEADDSLRARATLAEIKGESHE
jgi:uncharacterized coiled-coil DUF342 family protein